LALNDVKFSSLSDVGNFGKKEVHQNLSTILGCCSLQFAYVQLGYPNSHCYRLCKMVFRVSSFLCRNGK
jgi:hypothetical protein